MDLQKEQQIGLAAHLEEIAGRFTDIGTSANGEKFIGLDHEIPLGINGISLGEYYK